MNKTTFLIITALSLGITSMAMAQDTAQNTSEAPKMNMPMDKGDMPMHKENMPMDKGDMPHHQDHSEGAATHHDAQEGMDAMMMTSDEKDSTQSAGRHNHREFKGLSVGRSRSDSEQADENPDEEKPEGHNHRETHK